MIGAWRFAVAWKFIVRFGRSPRIFPCRRSKFASRRRKSVRSGTRRWTGITASGSVGRPAGRRSGAFKCGPRDRWIGWKPEQQFERLDPVAKNTRFPVLAEPRALPRLASFFLAAMTRRLADDWLAVRGHRVLVAETFCDPSRFAGTMCKAAGWWALGLTKGYASANGRCTDPRGEPKCGCGAEPARKGRKKR